VMGGAMANVDQWKRFETKFGKVKRKHHFRVFHTKKFKRRTGDFRGWTPGDCLRLIDDLRPITERGFTASVAMTLDSKTYLEDYRAGEKPNKLQLDSQYGLCFRECLLHMMRETYKRRHKNRSPRLHVVVESGHKNCGDAERIFFEIKHYFAGSDADMLETFTSADKDTSNPLMMADFIAHTSYVREIDVRRGRKQPFSDEPSIANKQSITHITYKRGALAAMKRDLVAKTTKRPH
jgi:hypothetical protein